MRPDEVLKEIAEQTMTCTRCKLHFSRKNAVPGAGDPNTSILFIGEGPGFHENEWASAAFGYIQIPLL